MSSTRGGPRAQSSYQDGSQVLKQSSFDSELSAAMRHAPYSVWGGYGQLLAEASVQDEGVIVVQVPEGRLRTDIVAHCAEVCRDTLRDEVLPEVGWEAQQYRYVVVRPASDATVAVGGDASVDRAFEPYEDLAALDAGTPLVRRAAVNPTLTARLTVGATVRQARSLLRLKRRGLSMDMAAVRDAALAFAVSARARERTAHDLPRLVPLGLPESAKWVTLAVERFAAANAKHDDPKKHIQMYAEDNLRRVAAAVTIQSSWRACAARMRANLAARMIEFRAALFVQRWIRAQHFRMRVHAVSLAKRAIEDLQHMELVPKLCLNMASRTLLERACMRRPRLLREHRMRFGFNQFGSVVIVAPDDEPRPGLPTALGLSVPVVRDCDIRDGNAGHNALRDGPYGIADLDRLLMHNATVEELDPAQSAPPRRATSYIDDNDLAPPTPAGEIVVAMVEFVTPREASHRLALLTLMSYDNLERACASLLPIALTPLRDAALRGMEMTPPPAGAMAPLPSSDSRGPSASAVVGGRSAVARANLGMVIRAALPADSPLLRYLDSILAVYVEDEDAMDDPRGPSLPAEARRDPRGHAPKFAIFTERSEPLLDRLRIRAGETPPPLGVHGLDMTGPYPLDMQESEVEVAGTPYKSAYATQKGSTPRAAPDASPDGGTPNVKVPSALPDAWDTGGSTPESSMLLALPEYEGDGGPDSQKAARQLSRLGQEPSKLTPGQDDAPGSVPHVVPTTPPGAASARVETPGERAGRLLAEESSVSLTSQLQYAEPDLTLSDGAMAGGRPFSPSSALKDVDAGLTGALTDEEAENPWTVKKLMGIAGRQQTEVNEAIVRAKLHAIRQLKQLIVDLVRNPPEVATVVRTADTGHMLAPLYRPLKAAEMAAYVRRARDLYARHAHAAAQARRNEHANAMERQWADAELKRVAVHTQRMRQKVVAAQLSGYHDADVLAAKQARVKMRGITAMRKEARLRDRGFAAAFARQRNALNRNIRMAELRMVEDERAAEVAARTADRRADDLETQERIYAAMDDMYAAKCDEVDDVKARGYTQQVAAYWGARAQAQRATVARRREDERARHARVGPAGGLNQRPEHLREVLQLTAVASAAEPFASTSEEWSSSYVNGDGSSASGAPNPGGENPYAADPAAYRPYSAGRDAYTAAYLAETGGAEPPMGVPAGVRAHLVEDGRAPHPRDAHVVPVRPSTVMEEVEPEEPQRPGRLPSLRKRMGQG